MAPRQHPREPRSNRAFKAADIAQSIDESRQANESVEKIAKGLREFFAPRPSAAPEEPRQAVNVTRGTVLATRLEVAGTGPSRNKGLLGRDGLLPGEGLWIVPCEAVHTFFMRFPIDLVYLDRKNRIKKVRSSVGAWRCQRV